MRKLNGHVCQPLLPWLRHHYSIPDGWNGKAKLVPSFEQVITPWEEALQKLREKLSRRVFGRNVSTQVAKIPFDRQKIHGLFLHHMIPSSKTVAQSHLAHIREILRRSFAVTPIDKFQVDGLVM